MLNLVVSPLSMYERNAYALNTTTELVSKALCRAMVVRQHHASLVIYSNLGSYYMAPAFKI